MALTDKQQRFVDEYLIDLNATHAAIRAGFSKKTAPQMGYKLLCNPEIQEAIQKAKDKRAKRTEITQDRVLRELAKIGFLDVRNLVDENGDPKSIKDLDDDTAGAIAGIDIASIGNSDIGVGQVLKYKFANKEAALVQIGKHLGMFVERHVHTGENGGAIKVEDVSDKDLARRIAFLLTKGLKATDAG